MKRKITYQMEKNVGIRKKSSKHIKNPRIKHKLKYKKALIKRNSQVPKLRTRNQKYMGEETGIKSNVIHSISLK